MSNFKICIEHLEPGMVLGKDVIGADGSVLIAKGVTLTLEDVLELRESNVSMAQVRVDGSLDNAPWLETISVDYARRFFVYVNPDSPFFNTLFRVCAERVYETMRSDMALPCAADIGAKNVEHMSDVFFRSELTVDKLVLHETELASFPDIYFRLTHILDNPASTSKEIIPVVSSDVALTSKLLKLVNSPLFGMPARIDSIERAVSLVGAKELSTLALGISTINFFKDIPPELIDMKTFWRHSLSCGIFCKLLAKRSKLAAERMFIVGLLHDVGRLVLFKDQPYASVQALLFARSNMIPLVEAEREIFGFDHAAVGKRLLEAWRFPPTMIAPVADHHQARPEEAGIEAAVVQIGDILSNAACVSKGGMFVLPQMDDASINAVGLRPAEIEALVSAHDDVLEELCRSLL